MNKPAIAYYSAEYAIDDNLPIFAGGLGVLAADMVLEAGVQGWPLVAFGGAYRHAVVAKNHSHGLTDKALGEANFKRFEVDGKPFVTRVDFGNWTVEVGAWVQEFGTAKLVLIDTNLAGNSELNRHLTANLYDPDTVTRLLQEFIVAHASLDILAALGLEPKRYHLNEGHMAFVSLALAAKYRNANGPMSLAAALEGVKPQIVGSKHTILPGAGDFVELGTLDRLFDNYLARFGWQPEELMAAGAKASDDKIFSTTAFMIATSQHTSAVSKLHAVAEHDEHPSSKLIPVTNGVHQPRWQADNLHGELPKLGDAALWQRHAINRRHLIDYVNQTLKTELDPNRLTIVWARRFAPYKRPTLLFDDIDRLQRLTAADDGIQIIMSGNANEVDEEGTRLMEKIVAYTQDPKFSNRLVYLPHYATDLSRKLVEGADVWLNTPIRGMEACGTSGMKAGLNGSVHISTSDGWIDEIDISSVGWEIPVEDSAAKLYQILEDEVLPLYYDRGDDGLPAGWLKLLRTSIEVTEHGFTAARMLEDYRTKLYKL